MKVLILNHSDKFGGAANSTIRIFKSLQKKKGLKIYLYVKKKNLSDSKIIEQSRFIYLLTKLSEIFLKKIFHLNSLNFHSYNLIPTDIKKVIKKINPDIIQLHWIGQNTISIKDFAVFNKPIIWRLSDMWPILATEHYDLKKKNRKFLFDIDKYIYNLKKKYFNKKIIYIAPSKWLKLKLDKSIISRKNKKFIIPNVIDTSFWKPLKNKTINQKYNPNNKIIILFGATLINDPRKGFNFLLQCLKNLKLNYQVNIFGYINNKKFEEKIFKNKNIKYLGNITSDKELRDIYSASDVVVIPSLRDNSPNILFEANACGVPVVAFDNTGTKDFIIHKKTGWLSKYKNSQDFNKGIMWSIKNRIILNKIVRRHCILNFSETAVSKMYINIYKQVI
jgi:glycosyltransferase involved in cell wall biosynthesis